MNVRSRMRHFCTITRPGGGSAWDGDDDDTDIATGVPCLYTEERTDETLQVGGAVISVRAVLYLPRDTDISEGDRITSAADRNGVTQISRARGVDSIARFPSHIEAVLESS
jgi:hypothetical protein